jgi:hypothetical protein
VVHVLSRAFSARTLLILVPRASPQAFLSHGFRLRKLDPLQFDAALRCSQAPGFRPLREFLEDGIKMLLLAMERGPR